MTKLKNFFEKLKIHKWKIIDLTMHFIFLSCSYYFFIGTWDDYVAKKSSFTIEEQQIKSQPTLVVTFANQDGSIWERSMFELGSEVNITYYITNYEEGY